MITTDIELASSITASTGQAPELGKHPTRPITTFTFVDSETVLTAAARYASGELNLSARHLLQVRKGLFREMKEGRR